MKRITNLLKISLLLLIGIAVSSCSKDNNKEVPNPNPNPTPTPTPKTIEWSKLEVRFSQGHSHGYFHGDPDYPVKHLKRVQRFYFENKDGKITPSSDNPTAIRWMGSDVPGQSLSLSGVEFIFYDKDGKRVNSQLSTGDAPNHYQFFFIAENFVGVAGNTNIPSQKEAFSYKYRDTEPEELYIRGGKHDKDPNAKKGVLRKEHIGLKGFFDVRKSYINFDMRIVLGYFNTKPNHLPYDTLPKDKVFELTIPIHIYTDRLAENKIVEDALREYKVPKEEIEKDLNDILSSSLDAESSSIFL
ncbi:hypothetical protein [Capnocytophaga sp. G2]|uniref:hypothetical protein n=1 Tax=Capnocytophaga sp. G2 TaxID=3110695 RepID=UPI002B4855AB|nr:hypothetical protein [Capnocytophaga sp. G2]MEB3004219.1 hypothetical protein [Capnocytophaga sp. G2]